MSLHILLGEVLIQQIDETGLIGVIVQQHHVDRPQQLEASNLLRLDDELVDLGLHLI